MTRCAYRRCNAPFEPVRVGQIYCRDECRKAAWKRKQRRITPALGNAFELLGVMLPALDVAVIAEQVKLAWLEWWLSEWAGVTWNGNDFIDSWTLGAT